MKVTTGMIVLSVAVPLAGCGFLEGEGGFELRTDRSGYEPGDTIKITATNNTSDVIYYNSCMPTVMEELSNGHVAEDIAFPTCACLCIEALESGDSWEYEVDGTWLWQNLGPSQPKIGPRYQFFLQFFRDDEIKKPLRPDDLITNTFEFESHVR